jgi:hypothetical protein
MAKRSKQDLSELDAAIDQLGGGVAPIARPRARRTSVARAKPRPRKKAVSGRKKR